MFFKKNTKLEEIRKLEKELSTKEYKNKLEELLLKKPEKEVKIKEDTNETNTEQIEILIHLSKIASNSIEEENIYLKEAFNYGSLKAGITYLNKFCHIYPENSIKIFNILNQSNEDELYKEVFKKEENANKECFNHLKEIYLNTFVGISYLKLNKIELAEKYLQIADSKIETPGKGNLATFNLGLINYNRENFKEAKKYFQKCSFKEGGVKFFLGIIAIKENDILSAISYFMKDDICISKKNLVILKLKYFFSYNEINECIEILEKEDSLDIDGRNLLGELYLMKKEITFNFKYKEKACYQFAYADNIEKLKELLEKGIEEKDKEVLNGLAVLRNRIRGDIDINKISIKASDYLKEIEEFNKIEKELNINENLGNRQFKYRQEIIGN